MAPAAGQRFAGAGAPPPKPKSNVLKTVLVITAVLVVLAAVGAGGWFGYSKYKAAQDKKEAAKGNPAARVATPTAASAAGALDLMAKVHNAYTNLNSLDVSGTSRMVLDMSELTAADVNPNANKNAKNANRRPANMPKGMTNSSEVSIKLARPNMYRIEGIGKMEMGRQSMTNTIAIWSSGPTNYSLMIMGGGAFKRYTTVKDRDMAFFSSGQTGGLAMAIPQMFFGDTGKMAALIKDWGQTDDDSVNGTDCYTVTAKMMGQKLKLWINKSSYLILQSQITLGAPVDEADLDAAFDTFNTETNQQKIAQEKMQAKTQMAMMTKIRGTLTETYDHVQTNPTLNQDDFSYPVPRGTRLTPGGM